MARKSVSIHASVKDATELTGQTYRSSFVSIHASVKDATKHRMGKVPRNSFNPRICKRCDIATGVSAVAQLGFNPRICKRCDIIWSQHFHV